MSLKESKISSKNITLVLTHQCNLRCIYCYEKHKDDQTMSIEKAKEIVDYELTLDDGIPFVEIDLFGGEPLLEFDTVRALIEYTAQREYPKDYIFFITTNGVLLDEERKAWLRANTDRLQLGLSLDGHREMHNLNRGNSFDKIDLAFFRDVYPEESVKMTISDRTLPMLADGVRFCHEFGFEVSCNLAYGIDWDREENKRIFEEQLMRLIEYYIENPQVKPCALLDINRLKSLAREQECGGRYCGAGYAMRAYDFDGTCYPCQHFLPLSVGEEKAKQSLTIDFSTEALDQNEPIEQCAKCAIRNVCPTCYGNNFAATGNVKMRDLRLCELNKIQFKAIAYFAAKRFENGQFGELSKPDMAAILKSALFVSEALS